MYENCGDIRDRYYGGGCLPSVCGYCLTGFECRHHVVLVGVERRSRKHFTLVLVYVSFRLIDSQYTHHRFSSYTHKSPYASVRA